MHPHDVEKKRVSAAGGLDGLGKYLIMPRMSRERKSLYKSAAHMRNSERKST